ncbi:hypothetical protein ACOME3_001579 [Neoechinorhynchus agilis]
MSSEESGSVASSDDRLPPYPMIPHGIQKPCGDFSRNPGSFEDLFRKFKELTPNCFEGARFSASKSLSSHFQVNHSLSMGGLNAFKWGASYVGSNQYSANEIFPVMIGDMDANGNMNANIIHQFNDRIRTKMIVQIAKKNANAVQLSSDYRMPTSTASFHLVNVDLIKQQGIFIGQYLRRITENIDAGIEYCHNYAAAPSAKFESIHAGMFQLAARYRQKENCWTGAVSPLIGVVHLGYWHRRLFSPIQFGVELEASPNDAVATLSYQVDMDKGGDCTFKAFTDSNWNVGGVMEKRFSQLPFSLIISGLANHANGAFKFGFGMNVG